MSIKNSLKKLLKKLPLSLQNTILFESSPDFCDNTKAVYDEMINRGVNKKYNLLWIVRNIDDNCSNYKCIVRKKYIKYMYYRVFSKCIVCCNEFIPSIFRNQLSVYLCHGLGIKKCSNYYFVPDDIDYIISPSKDTIDIVSRQLIADKNKIIPLGYPRNDVLCLKSTDNKLHSIFNNQYKKIIVWYPTFRDHKAGKHYGGDALPIIHEIDSAKSLNEFALKNETLIILKPHFAQNISKITDLNLSNILIINDLFFKENDISSYELLMGSDALITDYSSVYFDYLLCNKPISLIWEDVDEYRKNPGFDIDEEIYLSGAIKVYSITDLIEFVEAVVNEKDELRIKREHIRELTMFNDGNSSKRVVDFILKQIS